MVFSGLAVTTGAWLLAAAVFGAMATTAVVLLLSRLIKAETHAADLEAEVEELHDRLFHLADSEERFRSLVEAQGDYIVRRDEAGRITFANEGYARLLGAPRDDLVASVRQLTLSETRLVRVCDSGLCIVDEAVQSAGELRWISWIETTIVGAGGRRELQRVGRDVTDRIASERALEDARAKAESASEAKSRFLATVSHEIRTPLNGVLGMAGLLADTSLTPEQMTYVRALRTSGEALLSLIEGILDFSKIEAGKIELAAEPLDVRALVESVAELLAPRAQGRGIEIASSIAADVPRRLIGDQDRLRQVLMNLAGNAVKFTDSGGVGISVAVAPDGRIAFAVADTGPGIAPNRLGAIFSEFEQADGTASRRHEGTGLGLAISRRIVERMGGSIVVDSALGQGSTFVFALALPTAEANGAAAMPVPDLHGHRIVIVARSPFEARFLAARLAEAGARVERHETVEAADAALACADIDVLIADCALGDETVRRLAHAARHTGIGRSLVLLSPFERREFGSPAEAGFDGYLVKPVRARSLFAQLTPEAAKSSPAQPQPGEGGDRPAPGRRPHVLLAEDNDINALLAMRTLERLGATVDWARNGADAVALIQSTFAGRTLSYDLVLMDVRMPELDGLTATRRIRALEETFGRTPLTIVALTANAFIEDHAAATEAGVDHFLAKPFDASALAALLGEAAPAAAARQ